DLGLVALLQEAAHVFQLEVEVVLLRLGPHLDFLDLDGRLLLARFLQSPRLRVLVLAEVHDTAHRRLGVGRDFDEVELLLAGGVPAGRGATLSGRARRRPPWGWGPAGRGATLDGRARRRPSWGWGPAGRGATLDGRARRRPSWGWGPAGRGATLDGRARRRP